MRILITDGDEAFLEILQSYLWDRGHEAEVATDGLECIATLRDFVPDVLVLERDLLWGGCDGIMAQMRDDSALSETPVILMADEDPLEEFGHLTNPPLIGWLKKPFTLADLLRQIQSGARASQSRDLLHERAS